MDSIIEINDVTINEWDKSIIKAKITDENGKNISGNAVIKSDGQTIVRGKVNNGVFEQPFDSSNFHKTEYEFELIFSGNEECDPASKKFKLIIKINEDASFSFNDLQNATYRLARWIKYNKRLPGKIIINNYKVTVGNLMYCCAKTVQSLNKNENVDTIKVARYDSPKVSSESIKETCLLSKEEYVNLANEIVTQCETNGQEPSYIEIKDGKIGYMNLIYLFCIIIANSSSEGLLSSVYVRPWKELTA